MKIDVSIGELVDKVTILSIKLKKIKNKNKLVHIEKEYALLYKAMESIGLTVESETFKELENINLTLWEIEDKIRIKEAGKEFDADFIELARSVYIHNDHRAALKRNLNIAHGSEFIEEKEYADYSGGIG